VVQTLAPAITSTKHHLPFLLRQYLLQSDAENHTKQDLPLKKNSDIRFVEPAVVDLTSENELTPKKDIKF